jgi:hypothetical protein
MPTPTPILAAALLLGAAASLSSSPGSLSSSTTPPPSEFTIEDPAITESSGLAASSRHPGVYWTHNDSAPDSSPAPYLYAVDGETGRTLATITLTGDGVAARDIEAISIGPDGDLYVGDIGDNVGGGWDEVWIYRLPEPKRLADATITPTVYAVQYEDGPRDAEALMVHPETGRVYIASKKEDGGAALYASPAAGLSEAGANTFERGADIDLWVTDGAFSPDGTRLFLRGYFSSQMYAWPGPDGPPEPIDREVSIPFQQQGESVTFTPDGATLMLGSEGEASEVEPEELSGELLPESAQAAEDTEEDAEGESGAQPGDASGDDDDGGISVGTATTIVVGVIVILILRRLLFGRRARADG